MIWKDVIIYSEIAIKKFEGDEKLKEQIETMKEQVRRMKLKSPEELRVQLPKTTANKMIKNFKHLGISIIEIMPDISMGTYNE